MVITINIIKSISFNYCFVEVHYSVPLYANLNVFILKFIPFSLCSKAHIVMKIKFFQINFFYICKTVNCNLCLEFIIKVYIELWC